MFKIKKIKIILIVCGALFVATPVFAAKISFDSKSTQAQTGEKIEVSLFVNTEQENVNAFEGKITFPGDILSLKDIRDGNTIVNFWVDPVRNCVSNGVEKPGSICFSGITPGGFNGEKGLILSAVFEVKKEGIAVFDVNDARVLRNDGLGSQAALAIESFKIVVSGGDFTETPVFTTLADKGQPESFLPEIARDEALFGGKWFVVFATQDKDSGIGHYEIKESRQKIFGAFEKWISAESPYVLQDQELRSFIWIKVIDKANNERITMVDPKNPLRWYEYPFIWVIIILIIFFAYFARNKIWKKPFIHP